MSNIKIMNKGEKYAHATIGCIKGFEGKQFVKEATEATSCEISLGTLQTGMSVPFFHNHKANEENYIILSGTGKFQVMMTFSRLEKDQSYVYHQDVTVT